MKTKINQNKKMMVELMLMHGQVDHIINVNVVAKSHVEAKSKALKSIIDTYGQRAALMCEIRDIELIA